MTKDIAVDKQSNFGKCSVSLVKDSENACLVFSGSWKIISSQKENYEKSNAFLSKLVGFKSCKIQLLDDCEWDSSFVLFLQRLAYSVEDSDVKLDFSELPFKLNNLIARCPKNEFIEAKGKAIHASDHLNLKFSVIGSFFNIADFLGKCLIHSTKLIRGKSYLRFRDFLVCCRDCGASALPIISLISFLTGLTMAFVGSVQLEKFNATIYTADLVCLAMVREMGPLMVAIVMAGRTGASFAAELGSMKLNEEVDSLRTFGIPAVDFLVLPRLFALFLMTPLLTLYADIVGILGGLTVGTQIMGFSSLHYFEQTQSALLSMWEIFSGLWKSLAFGLIVGLVGCYKGINVKGSSSSLGRAVTSAVVVSIILVVVTDALFELAYSYFGLR